MDRLVLVDGSRRSGALQQIGGAALCLTNRAREYSHLSFSPDATRVIFTGTDESGPNIYEVPTLGGDSRLLQLAASRASVSPDRRWLACVPHDAPGIRIAARDGAVFGKTETWESWTWQEVPLGVLPTGRYRVEIGNVDGCLDLDVIGLRLARP